MSIRLIRRVVAKSASYTLNANSDAPGTTFTNKGASGAVTFTLPKANKATLGFWYRFLAVVDQNITVAPDTADTAIVVNDLAADSLSLSTSSQKIGGALEAECVDTVAGFQWVLRNPSVAHTATVAT